jgi:hypothetical protein
VRSGGCNLRINNCREALVRRAFQNIIGTPSSRSPARLVRHVFSRLDAPHILPCQRAGLVSTAFLAARRVRVDLSWKRAWELTADICKLVRRQGARWQSTMHKSLELPLGARREATQAGEATRSGGGGPLDRPPPGKPGTEGYRVKFSVHDIFCGEATRSASSTNPSPSRYPVIDKLPKAWCFGLLQRHYAYKGAPLTI